MNAGFVMMLVAWGVAMMGWHHAHSQLKLVESQFRDYLEVNPNAAVVARDIPCAGADFYRVEGADWHLCYAERISEFVPVLPPYLSPSNCVGFHGKPTSCAGHSPFESELTEFPLQINDGSGRVLVVMHPNGSVELHGNPNEAAREFWKAMAQQAPHCVESIR